MYITAGKGRLMSVLLEVQKLRKTYRKPSLLALDDISFTVDKGAIYAFVGPNGAGKTTTIRILASLLAYDAGMVRMLGYDLANEIDEIRHHIGYIPDVLGFYDDMLVQEYLQFFAACYGLDPHKGQVIVSDLLELVGLTAYRSMPVGALSRGIQQRVGLARALINDPALIIADEPAANLDPRARYELRELMRLLCEMEKTIFISSHILPELDDVATHIGVIQKGKMLYSGPVELVRKNLSTLTVIHISLLGDSDNAHAWLAQQPMVKQVLPVHQEATQRDESLSRYRLAVTVDGNESAVSTLLAGLVSAGYPVYSFAVKHHSMENIFLELTQES